MLTVVPKNLNALFKCSKVTIFFAQTKIFNWCPCFRRSLRTRREEGTTKKSIRTQLTQAELVVALKTNQVISQNVFRFLFCFVTYI